MMIASDIVFHTMLNLLIVSLIWAFSFGLIKTSLAGLDANFVSAARLGLSLIVFLPFFRPRGVSRPVALKLILVGAIQYGGMYLAYIASFQYLQAYQVALFTLFTPLYVTLANDWLLRRFNGFTLLAVFLTIAGAWIVRGGAGLHPGLLAGFGLVQISNVCFAIGQIAYRAVLGSQPVKDHQIFALPYLGGFLVAGIASVVFSPWNTLVVSLPQGLILLYLGVISSGLCFFLWNVGARQVNGGTLAIFNDLKVPLAVAVAVFFFGEKANWVSLILGSGLCLFALWLNAWAQRRQPFQRSGLDG